MRLNAYPGQVEKDSCVVISVYRLIRLRSFNPEPRVTRPPAPAVAFGLGINHSRLRRLGPRNDHALVWRARSCVVKEFE